MKISVQELTKIYDEQRAIDQISFEIGTGEIVGFLGPNGAGKTTTMKIVTCYLPPTSGTVTLDGYDIHDNSLEIRKRIGYLPEHNPLYLDMYVREYLEFVGRLYGISGKQSRDRVEEVIEMTGLGREAHKQIGMLSKGYRQRVGLCQALIHDPPVLILDEPTTGLDPNQIVEIRSLIKEIGKNKTIIFSTHILPEVEAIADRVIIIHRGKIVADEALAHLQQETANQRQLIVEFEKSGFDFKILEQKSTGVKVEGMGGNKFRLLTPGEMDIRRTLFEESVRQDNPIYLLQKVERKLEDIFREKTQ